MVGLRYIKNVSTLRLDQQKCTGCRMCTVVCPHDVFRMEGKLAAIQDQDACMECGACSRNCPADAIAVRAGVGCAAGILQGWLKGGEPTCDCGGEEKNPANSCC